MGRQITVTLSIHVNAAPEVVWDFTQDYSRRAQWDRSILRAAVLQEEPVRMVRVIGRWGLCCTLQYKQFERARRTSLAMIDVASLYIEGGGGSWSYEAAEGGTNWKQTNTLIPRDGFLPRLLRPIVAWNLRRLTRASMARAKRMLERDADPNTNPRP